MEIKQLDLELITKLENIETLYWSDYFLSASKNLRRWLKIHSNLIGGAFCGALADSDTLAFNRVLYAGINDELNKELLSEIIQFYKNSGVNRFFLPISPAAETVYADQLLRQMGFKYYNNWAKFYLKPDSNFPEISTRLTIHDAKLCDADLFDGIIRQAFSWSDDSALIFSQTIGRPGWRHYLAKENTRTVAAAALYFNGKFASLAIAGTLPEYRGMGAQSALIKTRINDAIMAGCEYVVVETADDKPGKPSQSNRNMQRFGFELAYLCPNYIYTLS